MRYNLHQSPRAGLLLQIDTACQLLQQNMVSYLAARVSFEEFWIHRHEHWLGLFLLGSRECGSGHAWCTHLLQLEERLVRPVSLHIACNLSCAGATESSTHVLATP